MSKTAQDIAEVLTKGGIVLIPTDTVLGLAVSPLHTEAVDRLYAMKARPRDKNLPIMVANSQQISALGAQVTPQAHALLASDLVPGALTLVLPLNTTQASWLAGRTEIAVRIPDEPLLRDVLTRAGPLLVTSANRSGVETPHDSESAAAQLTAQPDVIIQGHQKGDAPSTIVNCTTSPAKIERVGEIAVSRIEDVLGVTL